MPPILKHLCGLCAFVFYGSAGHGHWIYEKLRRPSSYFYVMLNMAFFASRTPRICKPVSVGIEPVFDCNLKCVYCWRNLAPSSSLGQIRQRPRLLDWDLFRKAVDELPRSVESIAFTGLGEPLMHPRLADMIAYAAKKGVRSTLYTNGTLLRGDVMEKLAAAPVSVVTVSVEPDRASSLKFRGVDLDVLADQVRTFYLKKRPETELKFSLVAHPGNIDSLKDIHEQWAGIADGFKIINLTTYDRDVGFSRCMEPWLGNPIVYTSGEVGACCYAYLSPIVIGDLKDRPLGLIINGPGHRNVLRGMMTGRFVPTVCRHCAQNSDSNTWFRFLKSEGK